MKIYSSLLLATAVFCFTACNENTNTETETSDADITSSEMANSDPFMDSTSDSVIAAGGIDADHNSGIHPDHSVSMSDGAAGTQPRPTTGAGNNSGTKLNPAHGEPGHDCAIPVGDPLGSAVAKGSASGNVKTINPSADASAQASSPQAHSSTATPIANPFKNDQDPLAAGLNPEHGKPGHDCAIPVGAPLKK